MPDPSYSDRWTQLFVITPSQGPLTGPNLPSTNAPAGVIRSVSGFMVDADATITFEPLYGSVTVSALPVKAGVQYRIAIKRLIAVTGATVVWGAL